MTLVPALRTRGPSTTTIALALLALALTAAATLPASAGATTGTAALRPGTGLTAAPSVRVRALQHALKQRGYHLGPAGIDGRFGPDTTAAVRRLQARHRLTVDGIVGPRTRRALHHATPAATTTAHQRTRAGTRADATPTPPRPTAAPAWPTSPAPVLSTAPSPSPSAAHATSPIRVRSIIIGLLVCAITLAIWLLGQLRNTRRDPLSKPVADIGPPVRRGRPVIAYVDVAADQHGRAADAIEKACARQGWNLLEVVAERSDRGTARRPGLTYALDRIRHGEAAALVVRDIDHVGRRGRDRRRVTAALQDADAVLVACAGGVHAVAPPRRPRRAAGTTRPIGPLVPATIKTRFGARELRDELAEASTVGGRRRA